MAISQYLSKFALGVNAQGILSAEKGGTGTTSGSAGGYINLSMSGVITPPFTGVARFYPPKNITIIKVLANLGTAPTSGGLSFIIKKNGTSIGTTFTLTSILMTPVVVSIALATTDYLTLDVSGSAASDLFLTLEYS